MAPLSRLMHAPELIQQQRLAIVILRLSGGGRLKQQSYDSSLITPQLCSHNTCATFHKPRCYAARSWSASSGASPARVDKPVGSMPRQATFIAPARPRRTCTALSCLRWLPVADPAAAPRATPHPAPLPCLAGWRDLTIPGGPADTLHSSIEVLRGRSHNSIGVATSPTRHEHKNSTVMWHATGRQRVMMPLYMLLTSVD